MRTTSRRNKILVFAAIILAISLLASVAYTKVLWIDDNIIIRKRTAPVGETPNGAVVFGAELVLFGADNLVFGS